MIIIHCNGFWYRSRIENLRNKLRFFMETEFNGCNQRTDIILHEAEILLDKLQTVSLAQGIEIT